MNKDYLTKGLNKKEVAARQAQNLSNYDVKNTTKSFREIISGHCFNYFNFLNAFLALIVIISGHYRNILFIIVVILNTLIGILQELRAKVKLDRLRLLAQSKVTVVRNGVREAIPSNKVVLDDLLLLNIGDQVPSDSYLLSGELLVDESFISGESRNTLKTAPAEVLAGSIVMGGAAKCQVIHVNKGNYINRMLLNVNVRKQNPSHLKRALQLIIKTVSLVILPLGGIIFVKQYFLGNIPLDESLIQSVAAMVGMIPEGLILLTSIALSVGAVKLTLSNTLIQNLYSLEMMARTDILCLDKTGTLTSGQMEVTEVREFAPFDTEIIANIVHQLDDNNQTAKALKQFYQPQQNLVLNDFLHFNSYNKASGATYQNERYLLGAYEYIADDITIDKEEIIKEYAAQGLRTVAISKNRQLVGLIVLHDVLRNNAAEIVKYLYGQKVELKLISGDNAFTLRNIAEAVKIKQIRLLDCRNLTAEVLQEKAQAYNVFARVSPEQKQLIVKAYQNRGHTVGMMGDGVNDVAALKDADFSISVLSAAPSAKNIANVILMDDDFAHIPAIINEGRRVINNIERTATLFLLKTCLSVLLSFLTVFCLKEYPFTPIQLTLVSSLCIGIPSFFLSLEPKYDLIKGYFLTNVLIKAIPSALAIASSGLILEVLIAGGLIARDALSTLYSIITAFILFYNIYTISQPLNNYAKAVLILPIIAFLSALLFFRDFFYFTEFNLLNLLTAVLLSFNSLCLLRLFTRFKFINRLIEKLTARL